MKKIAAILLAVAMMSSVMVEAFAEECNCERTEIAIEENIGEKTEQAASLEEQVEPAAQPAETEPAVLPEEKTEEAVQPEAERVSIW